MTKYKSPKPKRYTRRQLGLGFYTKRRALRICPDCHKPYRPYDPSGHKCYRRGKE